MWVMRGFEFCFCLSLYLSWSSESVGVVCLLLICRRCRKICLLFVFLFWSVQIGFSLGFFLPRRSRIGRKITFNYFYFLTNFIDISLCAYRTLHSYNLIWAVCHLFPQQRWRTHTYSVSGNHWPGEPRDLRKTTSARKFRPAFGATSKIRIFYKYVVFKHSSSFYTNSSQRIHGLSSV